MADIMPMELWVMTFSNLDYKDLRRCMRVNKLFQKLALDPKLRSTRFRGTVISTLTSYYQFLVSMYLPKSQIAYPPEDGWPNVTKELYLAEYSPRKTDEVIRLARHLPYVQGDDEFDEFPEIYPTVFCSGRTGHWPAVAELPPSVFCFAEPRDGEGYYFFLDVEQETIVIYGSDSAFKGRPNSPYKPLETTVSSPEVKRKRRQEGKGPDWREEPTYRVPDFFQELKCQFRELVVQPSGRGLQVVTGTSEEKAILTRHGWPSSSYDKTACMDELRAYAAEQASDPESDDESEENSD